MATCKKVVKQPDPPPVEYVLTLTEQEAKNLEQYLVSGPNWSESDAGSTARHVTEVLFNTLYRWR